MKVLIFMSAYIHTLLCPLDATPLPAYQYVYRLPVGTQTVVWVSTKRGKPNRFQCVYVTRGDELKADLEDTGKEKKS